MKKHFMAVKALVVAAVLGFSFAAAGCSNSSDDSSAMMMAAVMANSTYEREFSSTNTGTTEWFLTSESGGNYISLYYSYSDNIRTWEWGTFTGYDKSKSDHLVGKSAKLKGTWTSDDWSLISGSCVLHKTHSNNGSGWVADAVPNWRSISMMLGRFTLIVN